LVKNIRRPSRGREKAQEFLRSWRTTEANTYRAVYTVKFENAAYVLHAFQKKSPKGIKTAQTDVELVSRRLRAASEDYEARYGKRKK
jgi:phage-related protein